MSTVPMSSRNERASIFTVGCRETNSESGLAAVIMSAIAIMIAATITQR